MMASIIVTGVREVDLAMSKLEPAMQKKALRRGTRAGAKIVAMDAKARVPEDSGDLEQSIRVRALKRSRSSMGHGIDAGSREIDEGLPYYALFVEFGTTMRRHRSGKNVGMVYPQPFLRPALYENENKVKALVVLEMKAWLRQKNLVS